MMLRCFVAVLAGAHSTGLDRADVGCGEWRGGRAAGEADFFGLSSSALFAFRLVEPCDRGEGFNAPVWHDEFRAVPLGVTRVAPHDDELGSVELWQCRVSDCEVVARRKLGVRPEAKAAGGKVDCSAADAARTVRPVRVGGEERCEGDPIEPAFLGLTGGSHEHRFDFIEHSWLGGHRVGAKKRALGTCCVEVPH
jgi:hypothetical protein